MKSIGMLFKMLLIPTMFNIQNLILFWSLRGKGKGTWLLDHKKDVDIYMGNVISVTTDIEKYTDVIQNAADSDDVQYPKSYSFLVSPGKRKRNVAFRSPDSHESQNDIQERKLDKLCCLVEKLIESHSPPPKKMTTSGDVVSDDNMGSSEEKDQPENSKEFLNIRKTSLFFCVKALFLILKGFLMGTDGDILFLNIQSLRNHHDQLKILVASLKWQPYVVALCETWLSDNDPLELYNLDGYQEGVFVNRQKSRGGGLAFFIKDQIDFSHEILSNELENVVLTLSLAIKLKLNVCLMYRPPSINSKHFLTQFEDLLVSLNSKQCQNSIIVGDINLDILDVSRNSRLIDEYKLILSFFGLFISNSEATRETASSSTCIDHIISKYDMSVTTLKTSLSDNYALVASIGPFLDNSDNSKIGRNLKILNRNENILKLLFVLHQKLNNCNMATIDDMLTELTKMCLDVFDRFCPQQTLLRKKTKTGSPMISKKCVKREIVFMPK